MRSETMHSCGLTTTSMPTEIKSNKLLTYSVIFLVMVNVFRVQELFPFLRHLHLGDVAIVLVFAVFFLTAKTQHAVGILKIQQVKIFLFIYLLALLFIPFSFWPSKSLEFMFKGFLSIAIMFLFLIYSINTYSELRKVIWASILGVLALAIFSIVSGQTGRLSSTSTYDPNDIALMYVLFIPIAYFFMNQVQGLRKLFLFCALLILLYALIQTGSRGGFLGLMTISILIFFKDHNRSFVQKVIVLGILAIGFIQFSPGSYWERMESITDQQAYNYTAEDGRIEVWKKGIGLMLQNPITGVGAGAFNIAYGNVYGGGPGGFKWSAAHNSFLQIGTEIGVFGLILFIAIFISCFKNLYRYRKFNKRDSKQDQQYICLATSLEISLA